MQYNANFFVKCLDPRKLPQAFLGPFISINFTLSPLSRSQSLHSKLNFNLQQLYLQNHLQNELIRKGLQNIYKFEAQIHVYQLKT